MVAMQSVIEFHLKSCFEMPNGPKVLLSCLHVDIATFLFETVFGLFS